MYQMNLSNQCPVCGGEKVIRVDGHDETSFHPLYEWDRIPHLFSFTQFFREVVCENCGLKFAPESTIK